MSHRMFAALWLAVVLIGVLGFKLINDTDIFWQVKLGQIMLDEGRIPPCDRFTYTHAGEPTPAVGWLAQGLFASLYGLGGWHLARAVHNMALVGSLLVAAATCRRDVTTPFSIVIAMTIGFLVILSNADLRPQSFALLGFASLLALARGRLPFWAKLIVATPLLVVWQNMHPSVLLGSVAVGAMALADAVDRKCLRRSFWELAALALLPIALQAATPAGCGILDVARVNLLISRDILRLREWIPPWDPKVLDAVLLYWLALFATVIATVRLWHRVAIPDRVLLIAMTILSLSAARMIIFWAVALVPLWAELLEQLLPSGTFVWARRHEEQAAHGVRSMARLALGAALVFVVHPTRFGGIVRPEIPLDGVRALRAELPGAARIYNNYIWAGPLLLDGAPGWRLAVDGRLYFFRDPAEWQSIENAQTGRMPLDELERKHRPDAFFLYPAGEKPLVDAILSSPRWRACFRGPTCVAFVRAR